MSNAINVLKGENEEETEEEEEEETELITVSLLMVRLLLEGNWLS
tara:strand:- start:54 stop:188 length:135 start_codon:yes stop_codon:yes gene_type:complete